jgi:proline iminopeptidase
MPPVTQSFAEGMLDLGDGHRMRWEECGNPHGIPAVVMHGGPGSGATAGWREYFDPTRYRMVLADQRGCGRSTPSAGDWTRSLADNTTDRLIADFELLRESRGIDRWLLLGGSWGSTLALAYAIAHPERVSGLVLFSVTTTTESEVDWITRDMARVFPEQWEQFVQPLPEEDREGSIAAGYVKLLAHPDPRIREEAAKAWCAWEDTHVSLAPGWRPDPRYSDPAFRMVFARLVTHYWSHAAWRGPTELLDGVQRIAHLPAAFVHGRYDISSPLSTAWELHRRWPGSDLVVVEGGHGHGLAGAVTAALDRFAAGQGAP